MDIYDQTLTLPPCSVCGEANLDPWAIKLPFGGSEFAFISVRCLTRRPFPETEVMAECPGPQNSDGRGYPKLRVRIKRLASTEEPAAEETAL